MTSHKKKKAILQTIAVGLLIPGFQSLVSAIAVTNGSMVVTDVQAALNGIILFTMAIALFTLKEFYGELQLSNEDIGLIRILSRKTATAVAKRADNLEQAPQNTDGDTANETNKHQP